MRNRLLRQINSKVRGGLGLLSDAPPAPYTGPGTPAPRPPAAIARETRHNVTLLEAKDFKPGSFQPDEWSAIAYFKVPHGVRYALPAGHKYRMYLRARVTRSGGVDENDGARLVTNLVGLVKSTQGTVNLPTSYHPDVTVWCQTNAGWQRAEITSINYDSESVSFTEPAGTAEIEVYYLHSLGEWRMRVLSAAGSSNTNATTVANGSIGSLHLVDQNNAEAAHYWPTDLSLVHGQRLNIEVKCSQTMVFNPRADNVVILKSYLQQLAVRDPAALRRAAEIDLRAGG